MNMRKEAVYLVVLVVARALALALEVFARALALIHHGSRVRLLMQV